MNETKKCPKCEEHKPLTEFYCGNRTYCKSCERTAANERMHQYNKTLRGKASQALQTSRKTIRRNSYHVKDDLTVDQIVEVFDFFDSTCAYCEQSITGKVSIDHIIPLKNGGANTQSNIVVSCISCNTKKSDKEIAERFDATKQKEISNYSAYVRGDDVLVDVLASYIQKIIEEKKAS